MFLEHFHTFAWNHTETLGNHVRTERGFGEWKIMGTYGKAIVSGISGIQMIHSGIQNHTKTNTKPMDPCGFGNPHDSFGHPKPY